MHNRRFVVDPHVDSVGHQSEDGHVSSGASAATDG
jgi:hypothetical protein